MKEGRKHDAIRDKYLFKVYGIRTIRIKNKEVAELTKKKLLQLLT